MSPQVAVLGGGPAGLSAGWALEEAARSYRILEAAPVHGGNARTLRFGDFRYDAGPHRFHDRDPAATRRVSALLGAELAEVEAPSRILWRGRFLDFPLRPVQALTAGGLGWSLGAGAGLLWSRLRHDDTAARDFGSWARVRFGEAIAEAFLIPFSEKLWGLPAAELSPEIAGRRLPGFDLWELLRELVRAARRSQHLEGRFLYPRQGYGQILDAVAARLAPGSLLCGARVSRLRHDGRRLLAVDYEREGRTETLEAPAFVNTLPITLVARMLDPAPPAEVLDAASHLRFRDCLLVALFLDQESLSNAACTYFSDRALEFTRAHEPRNRSREMSPPGKTSLVVEFPCFADEEIWTRDEGKLTAGLVDRLVEFGLFERSRVLASAVTRLRRAYPVYSLDYRQHSGVVLDYLRGFENLRTIGRGGSFFYGHVHDFVSAGFSAVADLAPALDRAVVPD